MRARFITRRTTGEETKRDRAKHMPERALNLDDLCKLYGCDHAGFGSDTATRLSGTTQSRGSLVE